MPGTVRRRTGDPSQECFGGPLSRSGLSSLTWGVIATYPHKKAVDEAAGIAQSLGCSHSGRIPALASSKKQVPVIDLHLRDVWLGSWFTRPDFGPFLAAS